MPYLRPTFSNLIKSFRVLDRHRRSFSAGHIRLSARHGGAEDPASPAMLASGPLRFR
jgi:hypothetical protein